MRAVLFVAAFAAVFVAGCATRHAIKARATSPPSPVEAMVVHAADVGAALRAVSHSSLSRSDRTLFADFIAQNRNRPESFNGQTVRRIINFQIAYTAGAKAVSEAHARDAANRRRLAALLDARVPSASDAGQSLILTIHLHNTSQKTIVHADVHLDVYGAKGTKPIATMVLNIDRTIAPHASGTVRMPLLYRLFGSNEAAMARLANRPKKFFLAATRLVFSDGTAVGIEEQD